MVVKARCAASPSESSHGAWAKPIRDSSAPHALAAMQASSTSNHEGAEFGHPAVRLGGEARAKQAREGQNGDKQRRLDDAYPVTRQPGEHAHGTSSLLESLSLRPPSSPRRSFTYNPFAAPASIVAGFIQLGEMPEGCPAKGSHV